MCPIMNVPLLSLKIYIIIINLIYIYAVMKKANRFTEICGCLGGPDQMILQARCSSPMIYTNTVFILFNSTPINDELMVFR